MKRVADREAGSAVVEYVLVSIVLVLLALAVCQVALLLHTRNVLVADAAEGARAAAARDATAGRGEVLCAELVAQVVAAGATCTATVADDVVTMRASGDVALTLLPFGSLHLDVRAHAMAEPR